MQALNLLFLFGMHPLFLFVFISDIIELPLPVFVKFVNLIHQRIHQVQILLGQFVPGSTKQLKLI